MLIKASITAILAALLAGGVVYYGTPPSGDAGQVSLQSVEPSEASGRAESEPSQRRWIDKYLKPKSDDKSSQSEGNDTQNVSKDVNVPEEDQPEPFVTPDMTPNMGEGTRPDLRQPDSRNKPQGSQPIAKGEAVARIRTVISQAEKIEQSDLKDRAYMSVVDYAVANQAFGWAQKAISEISQTELRDTARSRIAVAYAKSGQSDAAFNMVEQVEVEALQDVIRLQTIEALILPERLPPQMR